MDQTDVPAWLFPARVGNFGGDSSFLILSNTFPSILFSRVAHQIRSTTIV
jgi:hypothetical protein